jgi:glycosyltransferase involved in cell wall biosynthesis
MPIKFKVLFVIDDLDCGGKQRRLISLLQELNNDTHIKSELVIIDDIIHFTNIEELNIKVHVMGRAFKKDPVIFLKLYKICKKSKPDIIHCWGSMPCFYSLFAAKLLKIKIFNSEITTVYTRKTIGTEIRRRITFKYSELISSNSCKGFESHGVPEEKGICIYNGFDFTRIENLIEKKEVQKWFGSTTPKVVGMVATLNYKKDHITYLLTALAILNQRSDVTFLVVGKGERLDAYKSITKGYDKIIFTGDQQNVESIINIFDIGVLLTNSPQYEEGISNSIMEYMALGKPVIATNSGGTPEIVKDKVSGFLVKPQDSEDLSNKITHLLDDPALCDSMGRAGKEIVMRDFSIAKMIDDTVSAYDLLSQNGKIISANIEKSIIDKKQNLEISGKELTN